MANEVGMTYKLWVAAEAKKIGSDGCSVVSEWNKHCCLEHDLAYRYHKNPADAFIMGWDNAKSISKYQADKQFLSCNAAVNTPRAVIRFLGVALGGWRAWLKNKARNGTRK